MAETGTESRGRYQAITIGMVVEVAAKLEPAKDYKKTHIVPDNEKDKL